MTQPRFVPLAVSIGATILADEAEAVGECGRRGAGGPRRGRGWRRTSRLTGRASPALCSQWWWAARCWAAACLVAGEAGEPARPVMVLTGFALFASQLSEASPAWLNTIGFAVQYALADRGCSTTAGVPAGRLTGRLDRWLMAALRRRAGPADPGDAGRQQGRPALPRLPQQPPAGRPQQPQGLGLLDLQRLIGGVLIPIVIACSSAAGCGRAPRSATRWRRCSWRGAPRSPRLAGRPSSTCSAIRSVRCPRTCTSPDGDVPIAVLFVFLQRQLARGMVAGLVVELGETERRASTCARRSPGRWATRRSSSPSGSRPRGATSTATADRSSSRGRQRAARSTFVERDGQPIAVLLHDPVLEHNAELVRSVCAAASLALENERLQAELRARLVELQASRARLVEATDAERRRIERDLHDGTQQRLVSIAMSLGLLESKLPAGRDGGAAARARDARGARARARGAARADPRHHSATARRARAAGGARRALPARGAAGPSGPRRSTGGCPTRSRAPPTSWPARR